ncbi:MAG: zinc ribbon domain-containing protein [Clostridia bacterium]|nr:zinc ribbon domain-containing protein [Clostridia bacterium]MBR6564863.1 zinc ribbon domain-containing protein [Clostridia bacterium]
MNFLDNALDVAKETFEIVSKKTSDIVTTQKQKFDIASLESKRLKDFQKLGEIYFNQIKDCEIADEKTQAIVESIIRKDNEIFRLKDELNAAVYKKVCPNCNSNISKTAVYCSSCGAKMDVEE